MEFCTIVLSFNHPEHTTQCLNSILERVPAKNVLLVHNGSELKFTQVLRARFEKIRHIELPTNRGFTGGVNFGLEEAFKVYEWVLLVTNDCLLVDLESSPPRPGLWGPLIYRRKLNVVDSLGGLFFPGLAKLVHCRTIEDFRTKSKNQYIPGTAFWLHRAVFEKVGKFDESLHTYWEDVDYSKRVQASCFELNIHDSTRLLHKVGKTCHKDPFYTKHLFRRNRQIVSFRYANWGQRFMLYLRFFFETSNLKIKKYG